MEAVGEVGGVGNRGHRGDLRVERLGEELGLPVVNVFSPRFDSVLEHDEVHLQARDKRLLGCLWCVWPQMLVCLGRAPDALRQRFVALQMNVNGAAGLEVEGVVQGGVSERPLVGLIGQVRPFDCEEVESVLDLDT
jgi:hypothetical protein